MEDSGVSAASGASAVTKKRRTVNSRRPRLDAQLVSEIHDYSTPSPTPSSDDTSQVSLDDNGKSYKANVTRRPEIDIDDPSRKMASVNQIEAAVSFSKSKKDDKRFGKIEELYKSSNSRSALSGTSDTKQGGSVAKRSSEGVLAPPNWKSLNKVKGKLEIPSKSQDSSAGKSGNIHDVGQSAGDLHGSSENKPNKVRLKVGGVVRTIATKSALKNESLDSSSIHSRSLNSTDNEQKVPIKDNSNDKHPRTEKGSGIKTTEADEHVYNHVTRDPRYRKEVDKPQSTSFDKPVRTSKRILKRRALDDAYESGNEEEEANHRGKLKTSAVNDDIEEDGEETFKKKRTSKASKTPRNTYEIDDDYGMSRPVKESRKRSRNSKEPSDREYVEEEPNVRKEPLTTRQRALQSGKGSEDSGIEFPNGLTHPPRRQKDALSEVERLAKKAEAAQRRRLQVEKQEKETQAEAIRKILGQDSSRKKKEEKLRQEHDEMAQKRKAEAMILKPNTIRWVMGPTGTILTFAEDIGLPSIFTKHLSYPPPREKCAGPSCTNAYKYRDSKSNLPLCSLQCYRAIQEGEQPVSTC